MLLSSLAHFPHFLQVLFVQLKHVRLFSTSILLASSLDRPLQNRFLWNFVPHTMHERWLLWTGSLHHPHCHPGPGFGSMSPALTRVIRECRASDSRPPKNPVACDLLGSRCISHFVASGDASPPYVLSTRFLVSNLTCWEHGGHCCWFQGHLQRDCTARNDPRENSPSSNQVQIGLVIERDHSLKELR